MSSGLRLTQLLKSGWSLLLFVFIIPGIAFAIYYSVESKSDLPVLNKDSTIDDFSLTNQNGDLFQRSDLEGKIVVADFFFTSCGTICPAMTTNLTLVQDAYQHDPNILLVSFTVDPEHDNVSVLRNYEKRFGINPMQWQLLTGDKKVIYDLARHSFKVTAFEGDENNFIHSEKVVLLDGQMNIRGYYDGTKEKDIRRLMKDIERLKVEES